MSLKTRALELYGSIVMDVLGFEHRQQKSLWGTIL
jgi:hypothetical protein